MRSLPRLLMDHGVQHRDVASPRPQDCWSQRDRRWGLVLAIELGIEHFDITTLDWFVDEIVLSVGFVWLALRVFTTTALDVEEPFLRGMLDMLALS